MKHKLVKKAYWVGSKWDLRNLGHPECGAENVFIEKGQKASKAKSAAKMVKYNDTVESYLDIYAIRDKSHDLYEYNGELKNKWDISKNEETIKYKINLKKLLEENKDKNCYIWSGQWNAYWRSNSGGYTNNIQEVGVYSISDAVSIALGCGIEKCLELQVIK